MQDYLKKQNFENAPLNINGSNFSYIKARGLYLPYLRGVKNLENTINLNYAIFFETRATEKEKKIIEKKLAELKRFIIEE